MLTVHTYRLTNLAFRYLAISAREESTFNRDKRKGKFEVSF